VGRPAARSAASRFAGADTKAANHHLQRFADAFKIFAITSVTG
jgi:hypothetical protein